MKTLKKVPRSHYVLFTHGQQGALPTHGLQSQGRSSTHHSGAVLDRGGLARATRNLYWAHRGVSRTQTTDHERHGIG